MNINTETHAIIDTKINPLLGEKQQQELPDIAPFSNGSLLTCVADQQNRWSAFFYDGDHWQSNPFSKQQEKCQLSSDGGRNSFQHFRHRIENTWMFTTDN